MTCSVEKRRVCYFEFSASVEFWLLFADKQLGWVLGVEDLVPVVTRAQKWGSDFEANRGECRIFNLHNFKKGDLYTIHRPSNLGVVPIRTIISVHLPALGVSMSHVGYLFLVKKFVRFTLWFGVDKQETIKVGNVLD